MKNRLVDVAFAMTFIPLFIGSGHVLAQPYPQREYGPQERQRQRAGGDCDRHYFKTHVRPVAS